jgi:ribosomal protein S18 acetylase RimI-like enzyme
MTPLITLTDTPPDAARDAILAPLAAFNTAQTGDARPWHPLAILISDPATNQIIGGLWGGSMFAQLFIELLVIPEALRRHGLGRQLMAQAEAEAIARGCAGIWLDTFSFQAPGFYQKLGYEIFGEIPDYPPGHSRYFLRKELPK